jgi:hypothetical protein
MINFEEKPASSIGADIITPKSIADVKQILLQILNDKDFNSGALLTFPCSTIGEFIDIIFLILKEQALHDNDTKIKLKVLQSELKTYYKDNNNIEKFLTMLLGSIIKLVNEYKKNDTSTNKR